MASEFERFQINDLALIVGDANGERWHYALGFWQQGIVPAWDATCDNPRLASSPGAFGWYLWIDVDAGYYAVLVTLGTLGFLFSPTEEAVLLGSELRPLIERALAAP